MGQLFPLQTEESGITKEGRYHMVGQFFLQSGAGITKLGSKFYKVGQHRKQMKETRGNSRFLQTTP